VAYSGLELDDNHMSSEGCQESDNGGDLEWAGKIPTAHCLLEKNVD
jgi:hypothetical protein